MPLSGSTVLLRKTENDSVRREHDGRDAPRLLANAINVVIRLIFDQTKDDLHEDSVGIFHVPLIFRVAATVFGEPKEQRPKAHFFHDNIKNTVPVRVVYQITSAS